MNSLLIWSDLDNQEAARKIGLPLGVSSFNPEEVWRKIAEIKGENLSQSIQIRRGRVVGYGGQDREIVFKIYLRMGLRTDGSYRSRFELQISFGDNISLGAARTTSGSNFNNFSTLDAAVQTAEDFVNSPYFTKYSEIRHRDECRFKGTMKRSTGHCLGCTRRNIEIKGLIDAFLLAKGLPLPNRSKRNHIQDGVGYRRSPRINELDRIRNNSDLSLCCPPPDPIGIEATGRMMFESEHEVSIKVAPGVYFRGVVLEVSPDNIIVKNSSTGSLKTFSINLFDEALLAA